MVGREREWLCHSHGTGAASFGRLELFVGSLGWRKANKERKCGGRMGPFLPQEIQDKDTGWIVWLLGLRCWTLWLSTAQQLRRATATRSTLLLAEEPSENKHKSYNWQH